MTLRGLSDSARTQTTAQYAAMGAKAGSIVPVIGTVIGAVVGAVVGWLSSKKPPPRPSAQQLADCQALMNEYMGYAAQMPTVPIPLDAVQLKNMNWCLMAHYGRDIKNLDPRYFDGNFTDLLAMARGIVKAIYATPVGGTVQVSETVNKVRGQTFRSSGITFTNPPFTNIKDFASTKFLEVAIQYCDQTAGKGKGGCAGLYNRPEYRRFLMDLLGFAAREELPNISEDDFKAASAVSVTVPGSSAKDVVTAVEQIIGRTVERGETAAVLTPATGPPPALPIVPTGTPSAGVPAAGVVPLPIVEPGVPQAPTLPAPSIFQPLPQYSPLAPSYSGGSSIVPLPTPGVAPGMVEKQWFENPYVLGGGALAIGALFFMSQRRRSRA